MPTKKKAGQPTKYKEGFNDQAYTACLAGFTDKQIAKLLGVKEATINNWKIEHPKFFESIKKGKAAFDDGLVENALLQSAKGFERDSKYYPPVPTSIIFWLKNRQPDKWRDKHDIEHRLTLEQIVDSLGD
jgi:hypothetical protein